jgi:hypothetical protein
MINMMFTHYNLIDTLRFANPELWAEMYQKVEGLSGDLDSIAKELVVLFKDRGLSYEVAFVYVEAIAWSIENGGYGKPVF